MPTSNNNDRSALAPVDLDRFFSLSIDMLCIAGFDGYFKHVNPAWERTLGWTGEELTTKPWSDFVHPDDLESTIAAADEQTEQGLEVISFENRYLAKDGSYHWLLWNSRPCPERGEMHAIARDITDRKRAEVELKEWNVSLERVVAERTAALEQRAAELAKSNAELEAFTYSVSHDLKEPLRTVEAFSQFVLEDYSDKLDDQGRDYLQKLANASARMKRLIEDLLALSRIGRRADTPVAVDVGVVISQIVEGLRATIEAKGATVDVHKNLPLVAGDASRVEQIFGNLIANGLKFNASERPRITVGVHGIEGEDAVFYVQDNGIGIDPQYHERIFGIFQRLHRREEYEGTGAGLAIVKRAVEALGGRVWVESALGDGTTFLFSLPLAAGADESAQAA
jgi:PAS domain S-box-containing protein